VKAGVRSFGKDEAIFREGEASDAVFVVVSGRVEMSKQGPDGPVVLAQLGPLEMFGEMGILDDSPRSATARALEKSRIKVIPKKDFRAWLQSEPDAAMRVMGVLVERLRAADAVIARQREVQLFSPTGGNRGLMDAFMSWFRRRKTPPATHEVTPGEPLVQPLLVGVATVNNDIEGAWTRALVGLLDGKPGVLARPMAVSIQMEPNADQVQAASAVMRARQVLAREEIVDLLVWGDVHEDGYTLCFTAAGGIDDERVGSFSPYLKLELPADPTPPVAELFYLAVLAAIEPLNEQQRVLHRQLLPAALQALPDFLGSLPVAWNMEQQRTGLAVYGNAAATIAGWEGDADWYDHAADVYKAAVLRIPRGDHGLDEAVLRKHLGGALLAAGDRRRDAALMEQAVAEFRLSLECILRPAYPQEWAAAQNRLGLGLYKLDLLTGQSEVLKEAMAAFQAAMQVFTRAEAPQRWADVMNNLAQVLQVYGDQMKSPDVLARAIDACRASLELRSRERLPLGWAASQNTLGTALFLLDKLNQNTEHLEEAEAAFTAAAEVYRSVGATRQALVAEKNLAHVQKIPKSRGERRLALPDWGDDE
jgi:tetratricopeptide (TPR) repeat protein